MRPRNGVLLLLLGGLFGVFLLGAAVSAVRERLNARQEAKRREAELQAAEQARLLKEERDRDRAEAAAAFADPVPPTRSEAAEFESLLGRINTAMQRQNAVALLALFDTERLFTEIVRQSRGRLPLAARDGFMQGFQKGASSVIFNPLFHWDRTEIRRVRWSGDRKEAVIIAVHKQAIPIDEAPQTITFKIRWWLVHRPGGWKVFDYEDLDGGIRATALIATLITPDVLTRQPQIRGALLALRDAQAAIVRGDVDAVEQALARCRGVDLPAPISALVSLLEGGVQIRRGRFDAALKSLERAEQLNPDMPGRHYIHAICLNALGDHAQALVEIEAYIAQLGADGEANIERGLALEGLNREAEAAAAYRQALGDQPDSVEALDGLRRVLPDADKGELAERIAKAANPAKLYDELVPLAQDDSDNVGASALLAGLRKARPDDPRSIRGQFHELINAKKFAEAAAVLRERLGRAGKDENAKQLALNTYLYAMLGADRPIQAYAAAPDEHAAAAFRLLADDLEELGLERDSEEPVANSPQQLRALIVAHRMRQPGDPWLGYFEAALLQAAKKYEPAERLFATAQSAYLKTAKPNSEKDWDADRFRTRRVECLYALKQGIKAYTEVGPVADTFQQLASAYAQDKDIAGLRELVAAHRTRSPDDPLTTYWDAQIHYLKDEYAAAASGFRAFLRAAGEKHPSRWLATDRCIRAYLRADRVRDARGMIDELGPEQVSVALRAAVGLAEGRPDLAEAILADLAKKPGGFAYLYYDLEFVRLISLPQFAELRKKYPDPRPQLKLPG